MTRIPTVFLFLLVLFTRLGKYVLRVRWSASITPYLTSSTSIPTSENSTSPDSRRHRKQPVPLGDQKLFNTLLSVAAVTELENRMCSLEFSCVYAFYVFNCTAQQKCDQMRSKLPLFGFVFCSHATILRHRRNHWRISTSHIGLHGNSLILFAGWVSYLASVIFRVTLEDYYTSR